MIDRQHGRILIECDSCDIVFEGAKGEGFSAAWGSAKDDGWRGKPVGADWVHSCPDCTGKN